mmetsp:Transcript_14716/g.57732  ORF Transcript_14716/g.57732 Transcript_14716/m.57732 type:complete len:683 (+) Transcript_14716:84-2132(+)
MAEVEDHDEEVAINFGDEEANATPASFNDAYASARQFKGASFYRKSRQRRSTVVNDIVGVGLQFVDVSFSRQSLLGRARSCLPGGKGRTQFLHNISGYVLPGQMMAVIGPSGAGKTTLLNVLAGKVQHGVKGEITVGGIAIKNKNALARQYGAGVMAYVRQDDALYPHLTVYETIRYSAWLRLPSSYSMKKKAERVDYTIENLGLTKVRDSQIGDQAHPILSGGERRRVTIGVEIIKKPSVLFLDEPTSGLDSHSAMSTVQLLSEFARDGNRAVVCTIHQPTDAMFDLFDSVLLLSHGRMMYFGDRVGMRDYFERIGFAFPKELPVPEFAMNIMRHYEERGSEQVLESYFEQEAKDELVGPAKRSMEVHNVGAAEVEEEGLNTVLNKLATCWGGDQFSTTWMEQLFYLSHRNVVNTIRTKDVFFVRVAVMIVLALAVGTMYLQLDDDEVSEIAAFFILSVTIVFFNSLEILPAFIRERVIFEREYGAQTYRLSSYLVSQFLVHLPFLAILALTYGTPAYWLVGVNPQFHAFVYWILVIFTCFVCAQSIIIIVAVLAPDAQLGNSVATAMMAMLLFFCGYFLPPDDIPGYWIWFHYMTPFKYAYEGLLVSNFNYDVPCDELEQYMQRYEEGKCTESPDEYLDVFDIAIDNAWLNLLVLAIFAIGFRGIAYFLLHARHTLTSAR